jgi:hypothetical protein
MAFNGKPAPASNSVESAASYAHCGTLINDMRLDRRRNCAALVPACAPNRRKEDLSSKKAIQK